MPRQFRQVDVFTDTALLGNPVAVVLGAEGLGDEQMQAFARWTNLSETTFVLPPRADGADYRVRIFTPGRELPFAGHPTLGTCHAWLEAGSQPRHGGLITQECGAGLVPIRRTEAGLAFAAPPLVREGPADEALIERIARALNLSRGDIVDIAWADNGPGWVAALLPSADAVLAVQPGTVDLAVGIAGMYPAGSPQALEVRAFSPELAGLEDPVTGSLNASLGQWLLGTGRLTAPYVASQGTALGRRGRVHVSQDGNGQVWVGGGSVTCVSGTVQLLSPAPAGALRDRRGGGSQRQRGRGLDLGQPQVGDKALAAPGSQAGKHLLQVSDVAGDDAEQVVGLSCHIVRGDDLRQRPHLVLEHLGGARVMTGQGGRHVNLQREARDSRVEPGGDDADHAGLLQPPDAVQGRGR